MRNSRFAITAFIVAIALGGCAGAEIKAEAPDTDSPSESATSSSPSPSKTAVGPSTTPGEVVESERGPYLQSTMADDDPAIVYQPTKADDRVKAAFSAEELQQAQQLVLKYVAEEVIDSPMNEANLSSDSWWETHQDYFSPEYRTEFKRILDEDLKGPVQRNIRGDEKDTISFIYSPDETRFYDRLLDVTHISLSEDGTLPIFDLEFSYKAKIKNPSDPSVGYGTESHSGTYKVALRKDAASPRGWWINAYKHDWQVDNRSAGIL